MRRKLLVGIAVLAGTTAPLGLGNVGASHALTCVPPDNAVGYACQVTFYIVGSACRGQLPTKPPAPPIPPIVASSAAQQINLCPPLG